jgi:hypothetical protein
MLDLHAYAVLRTSSAGNRNVPSATDIATKLLISDSLKRFPKPQAGHPAIATSKVALR